MVIKRKLRVLIVDDSLVFREALARGIGADPGIEVVGTAADPYQARDKILEHRPDVMTLDVEMPRMNGIEFLRQLMPQYPIPVVVVSAVDGIVFDALKAGAVDFAAKPDFGGTWGIDSLVNELIIKVKIASTAKVGGPKKLPSSGALQNKIRQDRLNTIIAIGASTGGTEAIADIIKTFPESTPGIVIVQHMPPVFTKLYAERLNSFCSMEVKEAQHGDRIQPGRVLIAPGEYHMRIRRFTGEYIVECFKGEKRNGHCPSVDILFESVAEQAGRSAIGVLLTGMGYDGAKGLLAMRKAGARTIGQDEQSSVVYGMPKVAYDIGAVEKRLALENIPGAIYSMILDK